MSTARKNFALVWIPGNCLVAVDGVDDNGKVISNIEVLNFDAPEGETWRQLRNPARPGRQGHSAVYHNNSILVVGGFDGEGNVSDRIDRISFKSQSNMWHCSSWELGLWYTGTLSSQLLSLFTFQDTLYTSGSFILYFCVSSANPRHNWKDCKKADAEVTGVLVYATIQQLVCVYEPRIESVFIEQAVLGKCY